MRTSLRGLLVGIIVLGVVPLADADDARRPNVLVILSDDQGWGDLSAHGNTNLSTPHVDSLAREGVTLDRFYVCPVCSPTRAEFLTGRYHPHGDVFDTSKGGERLNLDEKTIGDTFKAAGYATAVFGKWHNGLQWPYHPNARGFDEFYGFCSGHWGHYFDSHLEHNGKLVRGKGYLIDEFTDRAIQFIETNKDRPFICYLPYNTPHSPMQVPDSYFDKFANDPLKMRYHGTEKENLEHTRAALAMCENIDHNVGRLLKKLDELKLDRDTIVIYFSDNGPNGWRWNGGMRGRKGSTDEGGVRVPCFVRWNGTIKPRTVPEIAGAIDLLPTLADMAGIDIVSEKPLEGVSLKPLLLDANTEWKDRLIFSHWNGRVSVRNQRYRLDHTGKLYDMVADPGQTTDVGQDHPEVKTQLTDAIADWRKDVLSELKRADRPFPVGYQESPVTHLPARDGIPHGEVERSGRAPNCSFFRNWKSTDDRMTWHIEVATTGVYDAEVYYACPESDLGSLIELSFGEGKVHTRVRVAHDPPLYGKERDRTDRGPESYVKDFNPMSLGSISLKKGRGQLTLRALEIPGDQVMEVRYVVLTLKP